MESNINHQVISSYSKIFAERLSRSYFINKPSITGSEITSFSDIKQLNFFVLKILFEKWSDEIDNLESPYFDYSSDEVQKALNSFMNALSKNILVKKEDFGPLLEEATYKTLLLIFSPYEFYTLEINKPGTNQISLADLESLKKYVKINAHLLQAFIDRFKKDGIQAVFNDDALRIFDEVCEKIKETPEDIETYQQLFNKVTPLDLNRLYSESNNLKNEPKHQETDSLNEKLGIKKQTLLDTLGTEKKEALIDMHEKKPIDGLKKSITINQRFMFENDLFKGDKGEFEMVINYLDNCLNKGEAMDFLNNNYIEKKKWDLEKEEVMEFLGVVYRRFPQ